MTIKPILFSPAMVRALPEGRKTQTRRVIKDTPKGFHMDRVGPTGWQWTAPYGAPRITFTPPYASGDLLWVQEAAQLTSQGGCGEPRIDPPVWYLADGECPRETDYPFVYSGNNMPRWASRLTLRVTDVRVQRVQEISEADAVAEGVCAFVEANDDVPWGNISQASRNALVKLTYGRAATAFHHLWDTLNEQRGFGWDANPWVTATTFEVIHQNVDKVSA